MTIYTREALLDVVERTHASSRKLLDHCRELTTAQFHQALGEHGFGYPTVQQQLHHVFGAQRYWIGVLEGRIDADEDAPNYPDCDALESFRTEIESLVCAYIRSSSDTALSTPAPFTTWGDTQAELMPARVVLRVTTHAFQHHGQISAMCRLLGRPIPDGLDFPVR